MIAATRMTVSHRLLIVALLCLLPSLAAGLFTQLDLQSRRTVELGELAMRQAEQVEIDLVSILDAARQLGGIATQLDNVARLQPGCGSQLARLQANMARYAFLAAFRADGTLACASREMAGDSPPWLGVLATDTTPSSTMGSVGAAARSPDGTTRFLPVGIPIIDSGKRLGTLVVGIDLAWLERRQEDLRQGRSSPQTVTSLLIADRTGAIIARYPRTTGPDASATVPALVEQLSEAERQLAAQASAGLTQITGPNDVASLTAYVPRAAHAEPFYVQVSLPLHAAAAEIDSIALRGAMLVGSASLISLVLALAAGEAFIRLPTERLLAIAQRWRDGDLAVRAPTREERSEFGRLSAAFNEMAASLEQRAAERERAAHLLEGRVAERTAALSESNARLHVEIAEREKTEAALAQAQKLQAVGRLAGGIAHDFNNLLATIMGNLELLERRIDPTQERLHSLIARGMGAVQRGAQLTGRLLAFSRRHRTVTRVIDANRIVSDLVTLATSTLGRRIEVSTHLGANLWPAIADPSQLEAALLNLALNARDAMPNGGKLIIATENETLPVATDGAMPGDYVRIDVIDNGIGMTPEIMARAFEPFFTTKGMAGSGLGLSQVYGIAQQVGGTVRLRSRVGHGTIVSILLPRTTMTESDVAAARARRRINLPLNVLLVDDDQPVRQATAEMLREFGCTVLEANGGEEALQVLQGPDSQSLGLLIVDYAMPGLTGLQVAVAARNMGFRLPVLLVTGYAEFGEPNEEGADLVRAVLHKPFPAAVLEATMARMLQPAG